MRQARRIRGLTIWACVAAWAAACGGETEPPPPPPQTTAFAYAYSTAAPCDAVLPRPNDVFVDDDLRSDAGGCGLPADPIEAAIARVMADDGAPVGSKLVLPIEGVEIQAASITASVAFALAGTSSVGALPSLLLFEQVGSATVTSGWRAVAFTAAVVATGIEITPAAPLSPGKRHVLIGTSEIRNARGNRAEAAAITKLLTGVVPIATGAAEGLDAAAAARLERERVRIAPLLGLLGRASPPIPATDVIVAQGFTTQLGYQRLVREVQAYQAAAAANRFDVSVSVVGGDILPQDVDLRYRMTCPPGRTVVGCYDRVRAFRRGTIRVPKVLDANGHLRRGWATTAIESTDMPFSASLPVTIAAGGAPVTLMIPGFGRGRLDSRELANEYAGRLGAIVMAVELDRHGERTVDPATGMADLVDERSNGIVEFALNLPDGVPDRSGSGFFRGDPRAIRDVQIAAVIEILHVLETMRRRTPFVDQGVEVDGRQINLVAHGHSAHIGLHVSGFAGNIRTLVVPGGGVGIKELVSSGPDGTKLGFLASAPAGVTRANMDEYLTRLEQTVLQSVSIEESALRAYERLIRPSRMSPRVLIPHSERATEVSVAARTRLASALTLPSSRVSQHRGQCDNFFLFICSQGDQFEWVVGVRNQMSTFASSGGVTVSAPAP